MLLALLCSCNNLGCDCVPEGGNGHVHALVGTAMLKGCSFLAFDTGEVLLLLLLLCCVCVCV